MEGRSHELSRALEWALPLGVCCAGAQADGVPCPDVDGDCLRCGRADPLRLALLRIASYELRFFSNCVQGRERQMP